ELGARVPKGVLLYGPPGCGKTMLAKALANESGADFYSISGSEFMELYVGVGASRVRDLFQEARKNAPSIIFIDELDSIGRSRGGAGAVNAQGEQEQTLNAILTEMDGFSPTQGMMVLAATNRPDVLDPALLRPGRFDRTIGLSLPGEGARAQILAVHGADKKLAPGVGLEVLAKKAIGLSGADLANVMNEGALLAGRAGRAAISQADLEQALEHVLEAPERQRRLSLRDRGLGRRAVSEDKVTFADVAGQDEALAELREIKDFLSAPERFRSMGAVMPKGVLLYGPPGCGKTLMARALAGEANAAFFSVSGSEFVEVFVGEGASRVRDTFAQARAAAPAIIFIDELDAVGRSRGKLGSTQSSGEGDQTLTQILTEMDGFSPGDGVIVVGATNRPDVLDQALLRPGRFDRTVGLALPGEEARAAILAIHAEGKQLGPDTDLAPVAREAIGLSGADLANVMNEAALLAVRAGHPFIAQHHLHEAVTRMLQAPERQRRLSLRDRSVGRRFSADERLTFADVAGVDDAIEELAEVKEYLSDADRFTRVGARVPRGVLLLGPPGSGKTLLARAVAGEANAAFFSVSGSEFVEIFVGQGAARVREMFAEARSMAPSIIFIDEIDAVGGRRGGTSDGGQEREQTLNQMLVEMDGFEPRSSVIVMAATNRADILDPALLRPGRFDRQITISLPDRAGREAILDLHARHKDLGPDVDLGALAGLTQGFSGAELANVLNEAALLCARRGQDRITTSTLDEALDRAVLGVASRGMLLSDEERSVIAYHEAGHALVALVLPGAAPPHRITVVPRGMSLGHCTMVDNHDRVVYSRSRLVDRMATVLGGRTAEQLVFGELSSGAAADLQHANGIARRMVCELGMSDALGAMAITVPGTTGGRWSEWAARTADDEVQKVLDEAMSRARDVLATHQDDLTRLARALLDHETLSAQQLEEIVGAPPAVDHLLDPEGPMADAVD
ncbi:MAG: ATP-dependent zinc metalloprotease FtsH, partial [Acidimicrobiales bacterium]